MPHLVIGTAGHIDHGKSALVRALTGTDPDRLAEEKARGITIDLGFAHAEIGGVGVSFVDVPGHERFVKNMLAGATGIDAVLLVVSADESVMPQTREHFDICRLLGIRDGLVVLTKADLVDADTIELVGLEVRDLVNGSFLERAPIVAASAVTGAGLDVVRAAISDLAARLPARQAAGAVRQPLDRVFSVRGFGTVVTGTLVSGRIRVDDDLVLLPSGRRVKVRGLQGHGRPLESADAGQRLAVNLAGVEVGDIARGETLTAPGAFTPSRVVDAAVEILPAVRALRHGARVRFHFGTSEILGRLAISGVERLAADGDAVPVAEVPGGRRAHVRLRLESQAVVTRGDRFILRAYSPPVTIAGGVVLDPLPPPSAIRTAAGRARFTAIDISGSAGDSQTFVRQVLAERGGLGVSVDLVVSRCGLDRTQARAVLTRVVDAGEASQVGPLVVRRAVVDGLERQLLEAVRAYHAQQPLSGGMPREEARTRVFARADASVFDAVVEKLVRAGSLVARDRLALPGFSPDLSEAEQRAMRAIAEVFEKAGLQPPEASSIAASLGLEARTAERALTLLARQKTLVKVDTLTFHAGALDRLKAEIRALKGTPAGTALDVAAFKQRYGTSRKFAIPLLEFLDRERVTRRVGETRVVL
jgi:selenocysteine-specific elongation factor